MKKVLLILCLVSVIGNIAGADIYLAQIGQLKKFPAVIDIMQEVTIHKIVSLTPGEGVSGKFFLGSGTIDTVEYYFFYVQEKDGAVSFHKVRKDKTKVYFNATTTTSYFKSTLVYQEAGRGKVWSSKRGQFYKAEIHVPPNAFNPVFRVN